MPDQINDFELLRELYARHYATVYRLASYMLRANGCSPEDAADLTHDTFIIAAKNIGKLAAHGNPGGWLYKTAYNVCQNFIRTRHTTPLGDLSDLCPDPQDDYAVRNIYITLEQELAPNERFLIDECCIKGRSKKEVGETLGITAAAVRKRISRIRAKLHPFLIFLVTFLLVHYI